MLRHRGIIVAATLWSLPLAGCDRSTSPPPVDASKVQGPNLTAGVGFANATLSRAHLGEVNWHSNLDGFNVQVKTHDDADIEVTQGVANANGGNTGWHAHPGPVLVLVKSGALRVYDADDPTCTGKTYVAGTTFIEGTAPHFVRNEGAINSEIVALFFVPAGKARRIEADAPGNCPF